MSSTARPCGCGGSPRRGPAPRARSATRPPRSSRWGWACSAAAAGSREPRRSRLDLQLGRPSLTPNPACCAPARVGAFGGAAGQGQDPQVAHPPAAEFEGQGAVLESVGRRDPQQHVALLDAEIRVQRPAARQRLQVAARLRRRAARTPPARPASGLGSPPHARAAAGCRRRGGQCLRAPGGGRAARRAKAGPRQRMNSSPLHHTGRAPLEGVSGNCSGSTPSFKPASRLHG